MALGYGCFDLPMKQVPIRQVNEYRSPDDFPPVSGALAKAFGGVDAAAAGAAASFRHL